MYKYTCGACCVKIRVSLSCFFFWLLLEWDKYFRMLPRCPSCFFHLQKSKRQWWQSKWQSNDSFTCQDNFPRNEYQQNNTWFDHTIYQTREQFRLVTKNRSKHTLHIKHWDTCDIVGWVSASYCNVNKINTWMYVLFIEHDCRQETTGTTRAHNHNVHRLSTDVTIQSCNNWNNVALNVWKWMRTKLRAIVMSMLHITRNQADFIWNTRQTMQVNGNPSIYFNLFNHLIGNWHLYVLIGVRKSTRLRRQTGIHDCLQSHERNYFAFGRMNSSNRWLKDTHLTFSGVSRFALFRKEELRHTLTWTHSYEFKSHKFSNTYITSLRIAPWNGGVCVLLWELGVRHCKTFQTNVKFNVTRSDHVLNFKILKVDLCIEHSNDYDHNTHKADRISQFLKNSGKLSGGNPRQIFAAINSNMDDFVWNQCLPFGSCAHDFPRIKDQCCCFGRSNSHDDSCKTLWIRKRVNVYLFHWRSSKPLDCTLHFGFWKWCLSDPMHNPRNEWRRHFCDVTRNESINKEICVIPHAFTCSCTYCSSGTIPKLAAVTGIWAFNEYCLQFSMDSGNCESKRKGSWNDGVGALWEGHGTEIADTRWRDGSGVGFPDEYIFSCCCKRMICQWLLRQLSFCNVQVHMLWNVCNRQIAQ